MRTEELLAFIELRHSVFLAKQAGKRKPWSSDKILQNFRFCNVYRELDTETIWIARNWRDPHLEDPDLWFAMLVARFLNWHPTLDAIGYPVPFKSKQVAGVLSKRRALGEKIFTGAYTVSTNGIAIDKIDYVMGMVFQPAWEARNEIRPVKGETLASFDEKLQSLRGVSGFMSGQIIADLKYAPKTPLYEASDWWTWAASGPGSRRGLNRVLERPVDQSWSEQKWTEALRALRDALKPMLKTSKILNNDIHAQDLQNCLCEFDKYERVRLNEGRPRATYQGYC